MERDLQIPLHNPGQLVALVEENSMRYRIAKMRMFNLIRAAVLIIAIIAYFVSTSESTSPFSGDNSAKLFLTLTIFYAASLAYHSYFIAQDNASEWLFLSNAFWDIIFVIGLLLFFNVGDNVIVMGLIIICSTLFSSLTLTMRQSLFFGAIIALAWIFAASYVRILPLTTWPLLDPLSSWQRLGNVVDTFVKNRHLLLEPILFALSITIMSVLVGYFAAIGRESKISADINRQYNDQLRKLNDSIIEDMQNGLLVVSDDGIILTLNREARAIFGLSTKAPVPYQISDLSQEISQKMWSWSSMIGENNLTINVGHRKYSLSFTPLAAHSDMQLTLVMLEDIYQTLRRAQENRLTSLGRLTTGIAHEIKNPLGIVRNAMDLLGEHWAVGDNSKNEFFLDKMYTHTSRINAIINDINNLFTRETCDKKLISINSFLLSVASEARLNDEMGKAIISVDIDASLGFAIYFDPSYLKQILLNLMLNAVKHAGRSDVQIVLKTSLNSTGRFLYIDVMDNGLGVAEADEENIFLPFFSKRQSTGLGLYLVREMCVANQAQINYVKGTGGGCFRLSMERLYDNNLADE